MKDKLISLKNELESNFKERNEEIAGSLLALMSGEHVLFIGPPGTAKSLLAKKICESVEGGNFYYYLLTKYTTPEEIFGPLSLKALQEDIFKRNIDRYLPTANISFLDEIFKANSSILNSLLTILNERKFHNGCDIIDVPLLTVFGASNELPEEKESLEALYDRFLFRYSVSPIQDETNFKDLILGRAENFNPTVKATIEDIKKIQRCAVELDVDEDVIDTILALRKEFISKGINISDRRWKKIINVMRIAAACLGRESVDRTMISILQHTTWDKPEQKEAIRRLLLDLIVSRGVNLDKLKKDAEDLNSLVINDMDYKFPTSIKCDDCDKEFMSWGALKKHANDYQDHNYRKTTDRSGYSQELSELLEIEKCNISTSLPQARKKLYEKDLSDMEKQIIKMKGDIDKEREKLKELLITNIWISEKDRNDILIRFDSKVKSSHEIEDILKRIRVGILSGDKVELPKSTRRRPLAFR